MNPLEQDAIKRALAEEFGLTHIDDPDELRLLLQAKMAEMNALDRAAFHIRLGTIADELESGLRPKGRHIFLAKVIFVLVAWFVWRPLALVALIFFCSDIRSLAIRHALFWKPATALAIGGAYGIVIAALVARS